MKQSPPAPRGILEFCKVCKKCAKHCPSNSISEKPRPFDAPPRANPGIFRWHCDEDLCRDYWDQEGTSCTICYRVRAFAKMKGIGNDLVKWFIQNVPQLNQFWVWSEDLRGYGKMVYPLNTGTNQNN